MGINIALEALRRVILESPDASDWIEQFNKAGMLGAKRPARTGKRRMIASRTGGTLEYVPKQKGKPEIQWP